VPIGALALLAARRLLTERPHLERQRFDLPGAALLAVGLAALTLGLSFEQEWGWGSLRVLASIGSAVVALTGAVHRHGRRRRSRAAARAHTRARRRRFDGC